MSSPKRYLNASRLRSFLALIAIFTMLASEVLRAQFNPPLVEYISPSRELDVLVNWRLMEEDPPEGGQDESIFPETGVWAPAPLNIGTGPAIARANAVSNIGRFSVVGVTEVFTSLEQVVYSGSAGALSAFSFSFTVPVDTEFALTANFEFLGDVTTGWDRGQILMTGMDGQGFFQHDVDSEDQDTWNVLFSDFYDR